MHAYTQEVSKCREKIIKSSRFLQIYINLTVVRAVHQDAVKVKPSELDGQIRESERRRKEEEMRTYIEQGKGSLSRRDRGKARVIEERKIKTKLKKKF